MHSPDARYDVVIIGSGAGGGTIAHRLAPSGKRILILERGDYLPREEANWDERAVFEDARYRAKEAWLDADGQRFTPFTHYCVGGNTKVYGAALLRMREDDFEEVRHYGGVSPAWPVRYDEFEPYYGQAERLYWAHGQSGIDPCEPWRSDALPYPPIAHEERIAELAQDLRTLGHRPFPVPIGVRICARPGAAPVRLSRFDGYPDPTEVKADAHVVGVEAALAWDNVTMLTRCRVDRLETDVSGHRVTTVVATRDGEQVRVRADIVVVACGAINTAVLLLRSASELHPAGLANRSGVVGRHLMKHLNGVLLAVCERENDAVFQKTLGMTDFYRGAEDSSLPLGTAQLMGKPDEGTVRWAQGDALSGWSAQDVLRRSVDFFLTSEDLPDPENCVRISADGSLKVAYSPNNTKAYDRLERKMEDTLTRTEALHSRAAPVFLKARLGISGVSHQCGTVRFGDDVSKSALDRDCKAHDLDNLYVADGSFFPSSAAVNPSLTIMANALRVGDVILDRLGCGVACGVAEGSAR
ncbi:MAG: FAD-dependent oxidoreductase [Phycisphaerales bacterium]